MLTYAVEIWINYADALNKNPFGLIVKRNLEN